MEDETIMPDEQPVTALSREEILERSRKENARLGDERERKLLKQGVGIAAVAGLVIIFIIFIVNAFVLQKYSYELMGTVFVMNGINYIWQGRFGQGRKKIVILSCGVVQLLCGIAFLVMWVITLVV